MPTIQISQIILRSGPSIDLPGAPTSTSPLVYSAGLEAGEMAFMTDTGRVYVGHEPTQGQPNFNRIAFPWKNIEVLTENSTDTLQKIIGYSTKEEGEFAYHETDLLEHVTDWENVILPRFGEDGYVYRLSYSTGVSAEIDYAAYDTSGIPVKMGTISVRYFNGEAQPSIVDVSTMERRTGLLEPEVHQAEDVYLQVEFRFVVAGPENARYLVFQYKNRAGSVLSLRFKVSRPKAL